MHNHNGEADSRKASHLGDRVMETASMLFAGVILFTAIYGLMGMLARKPESRSHETEVGSP